MNRNIKVKKVSKSKQTNQRYQHNSPMKFTFTGMYPKQPPNISFYHFEKKKNQINKQYYMTGKQNKSKISNNFNQHYHGNTQINNCNNTNNCSNNNYKNPIITNNYSNIQQPDNHNRVIKQKQKRYTYNNLIDYKKSIHNTNNSNNQSIYHYNTTTTTQHHSKQQSKQHLKQHYNNNNNKQHLNNNNNNKQYNNNQYNQYNQHYETIKTVHKSKLRPRQPITLGSMKNNKTKLIKYQKQYNNHQQNNRNNTNTTNNTYHHNNNINKSNIKKQHLNKTKQSKYIVQQQICDLICTQYLSVPSINHSKVSSTSTLYNHNNNYVNNNNIHTNNNNYVNHIHQTNTSTTQMQQSQVILLNHNHKYMNNNNNNTNNNTTNNNQQKLQKSILPSRKTTTTNPYRSPKLSSPSPLTIKKSPQQQILQFQSVIQQINTNFQHDSLTYMQTKDQQFTKTKNINCYLDIQIHLNWKKRAVVINWMLEVLAEIGGKRQVLANAVNIFDRYLTLTRNIPLDHLQCTAVAALSIAAKLQDKALSAYYLSQTTTHKYTPEQIILQQYKIFQSLNYKVNTPTLNMWSLRLSTQWDMYLQSFGYKHNFSSIFSNIQSIKFKSRDQLSYYNYRWLCQYIDFSIMDINTLSYQPNTLALSFIYLILIMRLNIYTKQQVVAQFPYSSQFLMEKTQFNTFFQLFLKQSFGQGYIKSLLPMIQYCATFVILPLNFDLPTAIPQSTIDNDEDTIDYETFCSYQTKNINTLPSLNKRNRTII